MYFHRGGHHDGVANRTGHHQRLRFLIIKKSRAALYTCYAEYKPYLHIYELLPFFPLTSSVFPQNLICDIKPLALNFTIPQSSQVRFLFFFIAYANTFLNNLMSLSKPCKYKHLFLLVRISLTRVLSRFIVNYSITGFISPCRHAMLLCRYTLCECHCFLGTCCSHLAHVTNCTCVNGNFSFIPCDKI